VTTDTTTDPELDRLLIAYAGAAYHFSEDEIDKARAALFAHIAAAYVRRDRLYGKEELVRAVGDRATWPLRAMVGDRRYGSDTADWYNMLDCGHESSVLHGGQPERMPGGGYGKRCRRCAREGVSDGTD
jgi:hypothetical protein